jgi:hypothetical protein
LELCGQICIHRMLNKNGVHYYYIFQPNDNCGSVLRSLIGVFSLQGVLKGLLKTCAYREPDATCRYSQCHNISSHIIPSEHIFYR